MKSIVCSLGRTRPTRNRREWERVDYVTPLVQPLRTVSDADDSFDHHGRHRHREEVAEVVPPRVHKPGELTDRLLAFSETAHLDKLQEWHQRSRQSCWRRDVGLEMTKQVRDGIKHRLAIGWALHGLDDEVSRKSRSRSSCRG